MMINGWIIPIFALFIAAIVWTFAYKQRLLSLSTSSWIILVIPYIRRVVYGIALVWITAVYLYAAYTFPTSAASGRAMTRVFGFSALACVFLTLIPGLLQTYFPSFSINTLLIRARRALGVCVFLFSVLHSTSGFFFNLNGTINAFYFLALQHQYALVFSGAALIIFAVLTITSTDKAVQLLGKKWKKLHQFVYLAGILAVLHAFMIGSHFVRGASPIPLFINFVTVFFIFLEIGATWKRLREKNVNRLKKYSIVLFLLFVGLLATGLSSRSVSYAYDPHARHRQGYSKDYAVELLTSPETVTPNTPLTLTFIVTDKRTGKRVDKFRIVQEKLMHVIVLSKNLSYYDHIHPEYMGNGEFTVTTSLPKDDEYRLYVEYSPPDFFENVTIVPLKTKTIPNENTANLSVNGFDKQYVQRYRVMLSPGGPFRRNETVDFTYTISDLTTGKPIDTLEPYLGAFGHLAMVSEDGLTYVHVHPIDIPALGQKTGGPVIRFNTYFPKTGKYKLFAQFQHEGTLFVTDFVVEAK